MPDERTNPTVGHHPSVGSQAINDPRTVRDQYAGIRFVWDARKARYNERKHGVRFEDAMSVFADRLSVTVEDQKHAIGEQRWITTGVNAQGRMLVVWHADTNIDVEVRLIGAREPSPSERKEYEEQS